MTTTAGDRTARLAVVALVLVALGLRLPGLATRSLWLDEAWRANLAVAPSWQAFWAEVLGAGAGGIGAPLPPLFALLLRAVALVVGRSTAGLRALPLAASVAAVPLGYLVARRVRGRAAGVAAAFCFACYPAVVFHGQELKQYSVDVLGVLVLLWLVARTVEEPEKRARWVLVAAAMALAPGFSYPAALVLPGLALGLLVACRTRRARIFWTAAHVVAAVAALAWYVAVIGPQRARPLTTAYWAASFAPRGSEMLLPWALAQLRAVVDYVLGQPLWLVVPAVLVGYLSTPRWLRVTALVTVAVVIAAAAFAVYPLAGGRTSLFLAPLLYAPLAAAVAWLASLGATASPGAPALSSARVPLAAGRRVLGGLALVAAVGLAAFPARGSLGARAGLVVEETAPLVAWLAAERQAGDRVYVYYGAVPAFRFYHPELDERITLGGSHRDDVTAYAKELTPLLVRGERVWLLFAHVFPTRAGQSERDAVLATMRLYGRELAARPTEGASLHLYEVTRAPGSVRYLQLSPEDLRDPERMRELLGR